MQSLAISNTQLNDYYWVPLSSIIDAVTFMLWMAASFRFEVVTVNFDKPSNITGVGRGDPFDNDAL